VYLLHFEHPCNGPMRHYAGKSESSRFLNGSCVLRGGEFAELTGCFAGSRAFSAAAGPFAEVQPAELAADVDRGDAYGSAADREACAFQDIQEVCRFRGADCQDIVNVPGVIALPFGRADHEVDVLAFPCHRDHCRDQPVQGVPGQQRPDEPHAFLGDCPGPQHGLQDAASGHLKTVGPDHEPGSWHPACLPVVGPVPALQVPFISGERVHGSYRLVSGLADLPGPWSGRCAESHLSACADAGVAGGLIQCAAFGAGAYGGLVADPQQVGKPQRVTAAGLGFVVKPVGTQVLGGDAGPAHGGLDVAAAGGLQAACGALVDQQVRVGGRGPARVPGLQPGAQVPGGEPVQRPDAAADEQGAPRDGGPPTACGERGQSPGVGRRARQRPAREGAASADTPGREETPPLPR
jgi:hypothetical protein